MKLPPSTIQSSPSQTRAHIHKLTSEQARALCQHRRATTHTSHVSYVSGIMQMPRDICQMTNCRCNSDWRSTEAWKNVPQDSGIELSRGKKKVLLFEKGVNRKRCGGNNSLDSIWEAFTKRNVMESSNCFLFGWHYLQRRLLGGDSSF